MNAQLILRLVWLRYKLLWSRARTRTGKAAMFMLGCVSLVAMMLVFSFGGFGAAMAAVQSGKPELIAQSVLEGLFFSATCLAVLGGLGVKDAFSDTAIRRYALNARGRLVARHITAFLDPVWILVLALELGFCVGLSILGAASFWLGVLVIVLLVGTNYLLARDLTCLAAGLIRTRGGKIVLLVLILGSALTAFLLAPSLLRNPTVSGAYARLPQFSPASAAASLLIPRTTSNLPAKAGLLLLWTLGLLAVLPRIERWSTKPIAARAGPAVWGSHYEWFASLFGPLMAPLIAKSLRYYLRCNKVWYTSVGALVVIFTQIGACPISKDPRERFLLALGVYMMAGVFGPLPVSANQFGYEALSFRRYLLLPISPALVLRANSFVSLALGGTEIVFLVLLWIGFAPVPFDIRMPLMLLASAVTSMSLFNAVGIWISVLAPGAADYDALVGFNVSVAAAVSVHVVLWPSAIGGQVLRAFGDPRSVLEYWWVSVPAVLTGLAIYYVSLRSAEAALCRRKNLLMNRLEGRG